MTESMEWEKFRVAIAKATTELECCPSMTWYRGVGDNNFRLYPSIFQPKNSPSKINELELFARFAGLPEFSNVRDSWDTLIEMQHRRTPTRLLDWTETLFVALYFAISAWERHGRTRVPAIYVLNPELLTKKARGSNYLKNFMRSSSTIEIPDYSDCFIRGTKKWPYQMPVPFVVARRSDRIRAQRGYFTIHGHDKRPVDWLAPHAVRQVRVNSIIIDRIKEYLEYGGIDELSMFPDAEGLARFIEQRYGAR
jgi:hypothetical protein